MYAFPRAARERETITNKRHPAMFFAKIEAFDYVVVKIELKLEQRVRV